MNGMSSADVTAFARSTEGHTLASPSPPRRSLGGALLAPRDGILGLARAVGAPAKRAQLLGEQHRLVAVGPAQEDALLAPQLDAARLLGGGSGGRRPVAVGAGITGACTADRAVGQDAVVPVAPLDAECVAPHLLQTRDPRARGHRLPGRGGTQRRQRVPGGGHPWAAE